ncbi:hypothetical protein P7K49_023632 [Saguinus oedipus]|uniref:Ribosomal protein L23/L25 N-terminal domain-containing protein n=1 Tax=Saguinus oedipus TaxID=9490 RepID=A0ABQ9UMU2_SAGOE|nr:hypothetical protein P7K49_023632 [Saguinus oedipus]
MAPKAKQEVPAPVKVEAKAKSLKAKKAVLKVSTATKEEDLQITHFPAARDTVTLKVLLTTESAMRKTDNNNTLVFTVDVKADKHQIKQAVRKLYDTDVAKVHTLIQPDGEKACVPLALDYDALDIAHKTDII